MKFLLSLVKKPDGRIALHCDDKEVEFAQVFLQHGAELASVVSITIPLDKMELHTERASVQ